MTAFPDGPLVAFYGDDFTGSTDAMELMAFAGLPTVLFLRPLDSDRLARFSDRRGIGVAGFARSKAPSWMDAHLGVVFKELFALGAPVTQYKVCSTFDSAPNVGSTGRAIDIALPLAPEPWSPMVVGAPQLRRWQSCGNLFAGGGDQRYRLDRHPTITGLFSASSSGLQYALVAYWRAAGLLPETAPRLQAPKSVDRLLVLSGSCSPGTAEQIAAAEDAGFHAVRLDGTRVADPARRDGAIAEVLDSAGSALRCERDTLVYTARWPNDSAIARLRKACGSGVALGAAQEALGDALGLIAATLVAEHGLHRLVVAGGDTSGRVPSRLPVEALESVSPLAPGSPVYRGHSDHPRYDGLELVLKGGQVGGADLFIQATGRA